MKHNQVVFLLCSDPFSSIRSHGVKPNRSQVHRVNPQAQWDFTFCHSSSSLFPANWSTCYCFTCARCIPVSGSWSFLYLCLADSSSSVYFLQMTSQSRSFWPLHLTLQFFSTPTSNSFPDLFLFFFLSVWLSNTLEACSMRAEIFFFFHLLCMAL